MKEKLNKLAKYFTAVHPLINIMAASALIYSLCYEILLTKLPEAFSWGAELTSILSQISVAVFSSYIFYVIVVKKKEVDDWENIKPTIALCVLRITSQYERQLKVLAESSGCTIDSQNIDSLTEALNKISPRNECKLRISRQDGSYLNWYTCLVQDQNDLGDNLDKLFNISPFLDSKLIAILNSLAGLDVKLMLESFTNNVKGDNLTFIKGAFFAYCKSCEKLNKYRLENLDIF